MKKIGIVTINDFNNYGNRLQCFAVQKILERMGCIPEVIYNTCSDVSTTIRIKRFIKYILNRKNERIFYKRRKNFKNFNKIINFSEYKIKNKSDEKLNNKYDYFVVGSDQVWNPNFNTTTDANFLDFASDNKKIAFSASFGVSSISEDKKKYFKEKLSKFSFISVRENSGKQIIKDLQIDKTVEVLVDPTLMLTKSDWSKYAKKPEYIGNEKFILNYFLGELSNDKKRQIDKIAKKYNCKIINILDKNSKFYSCGPNEFLWLEKNAFLICTDSFHSCVFSLIFNRPFVIFERNDSYEKMNSRLETLLNKFELNNRMYNGKEITNENINHDYSKAYKILEKECEKSREYLEKALDIKRGIENE